jgi:hypothetical protein
MKRLLLIGTAVVLMATSANAQSFFANRDAARAAGYGGFGNMSGWRDYRSTNVSPANQPTNAAVNRVPRKSKRK